ncbi:MAG: MFS transporter, partial [Xanthomonadales bacterium]|nr:MFS transporter [Xanthomonadales bacterium]
MIRILSSVAPLLLGVAILLTGQGLQGTLLPVRANLEGFSTLAIGLMGGAYFFGFTLGCLRGSTLLRRVGHIRVFAAMTAAASAVPLLHGLWVETWLWWVLRFVTGYCFAVLYVVIESWLNELATNETRGMVFSAYTLITLTVLAVGQQMLLLYDPQQMALFAIASAMVSLAAIPVVLSVAPTPRQAEERVRLDVRRLFRISPAGALGCLASGLANGPFWALAPVFVAGYSSNVSLVAWFMTSAVLGGALGQWPLGFWSDRVDRRWVIAFAALMGLLVGLATWLFSTHMSPGLLMALGAAWGAVAFPLYAVSVAHTNDHARPGEYVMISSGLLLMYGIGAIAGPFMASLAMSWMGSGGLFLYTAVVHILLLGYVAFRFVKREPVQEEEHRKFVDALAGTQTASHVYEDELAEQEQS